MGRVLGQPSGDELQVEQLDIIEIAGIAGPVHRGPAGRTRHGNWAPAAPRPAMTDDMLLEFVDRHASPRQYTGQPSPMVKSFDEHLRGSLNLTVASMTLQELAFSGIWRDVLPHSLANGDNRLPGVPQLIGTRWVRKGPVNRDNRRVSA
jgi:hypothetical protein